MTKTEQMTEHGNGKHADHYEPGCPVCDKQFAKRFPVKWDPEPIR